MSEICNSFSGQDVDICIYPGADSVFYNHRLMQIDHGSDNHYYSLYGYSRFEKLDLLVISFGTITGVERGIAFEEFLKGIPDVPIILLEDDRKIKNGIHMMTDGYKGMKEIVEHLIKVHGYRKLMFVSGPVRLRDARRRLLAFEDAMRENGLEFTEKQIVYGDFTNQVDGLIEEALALQEGIEAIVCANDLMAESAYRVAKRRGYRIGMDLAITGYDDLSSAWAMDPPLTTIRQDYEGMAEAIVHVAPDIFAGNPVSDILLREKIKCRASCGCQNVNEKEGGMVSRFVLRNWEELREQRFQHMMSSVVLRNAMVESVTFDYFYKCLADQLQRLDTRRAAVLLLEKPVFLGKKDQMYLPDELCLCVEQNGEKTCIHPIEEARRIQLGEMSDIFGTVEAGNVVATYLLYCGPIQYGILYVEIPLNKLLFYYTMSLEIGSGLKFLQLALDQQRMRRELENKNEELYYVATRDVLTGLYNRNGVMNRAASFVRTRKESDRFVAVMADLDHLKQINDTFGHGEGDDAIREAARILSEALPEGSPAGRSGGDEFTAVFLIEEEEQIEQFCGRLRTGCEQYNGISDKPYYVNLSVGCHEFSYQEMDDFSEILKKADQVLYENKKTRRKSVLRDEKGGA